MRYLAVFLIKVLLFIVWLIVCIFYPFAWAGYYIWCFKKLRWFDYMDSHDQNPSWTLERFFDLINYKNYRNNERDIFYRESINF